MPKLREALEQALEANPDDLATHRAYADYLQEQPDAQVAARGELIHVQLQLEDSALSPDDRDRCRQREEALLQHSREWLGELAGYLVDRRHRPARVIYHDKAFDFAIARGWLDTVEVGALSVEFARALARAPLARLLRRLVIHTVEMESPPRYSPGKDVPRGARYPGLYPLLGSLFLPNLRVFQLGVGHEPRAALGLLWRMPRLEELRLQDTGIDTTKLFAIETLTRLRVLEVSGEVYYDLEALAGSPHFGQLRELVVSPNIAGSVDWLGVAQTSALFQTRELPALKRVRLEWYEDGDLLCQEIAQSDLLGRLEVLELNWGNISDDGARTLARCPALARLKRLDLSRNYLSAEGIAELRQTGIEVVAGEQWDPAAGLGWADDYDEEDEWE